MWAVIVASLKMAHPNKRRKGKRRWSKLGFLVFYTLFVAIAVGRRSTVSADSDEMYLDQSSNPSNITIKLNMYNNDNNVTGEWLIRNFSFYFFFVWWFDRGSHVIISMKWFSGNTISMCAYYSLKVWDLWRLHEVLKLLWGDSHKTSQFVENFSTSSTLKNIELSSPRGSTKGFPAQTKTSLKRLRRKFTVNFSTYFTRNTQENSGKFNILSPANLVWKVPSSYSMISYSTPPWAFNLISNPKPKICFNYFPKHSHTLSDWTPSLTPIQLCTVRV